MDSSFSTLVSALKDTTDHCTGWFEGNWAYCCQIHDLQYALQYDKMQADLELFQCVWNTGNWINAVLMLLGVSVFGWIFYPKNKRK